MAGFPLVRLVVGADGKTDFVDDELPFDQQRHAPPAEPAGLARLGPSESVAIMRADRDWGGDTFHPAPRRQLLTAPARSTTAAWRW